MKQEADIIAQAGNRCNHYCNQLWQVGWYGHRIRGNCSRGRKHFHDPKPATVEKI